MPVKKDAPLDLAKAVQFLIMAMSHMGGHDHVVQEMVAQAAEAAGVHLPATDDDAAST